jgi:hypothetical protein
VDKTEKRGGVQHKRAKKEAGLSFRPAGYFMRVFVFNLESLLRARIFKSRD